MLLPYSDKGPVNLVDPWVIFGKELRIVTIFSPIISSQDILTAEGTAPVSIAEQIYGSLIKLGSENKEPVKMIINSHGGNILPGFTILQGMEHLKAKNITVVTVNICNAMSMAGVLLMMGTKGHRYVLKDTLTLTHFGERGGGGRTAEDIEELKKHTERINQRLYELMADNSNIPEYHVKRQALAEEMTPSSPSKVKTDKELRVKLVRKFLGTNVFMSPEETLEAGIADKILIPGDPLIDEIFSKSYSGGGR